MLNMKAEEYIDNAVRKGESSGLDALEPLERKVFLIAEAEVLCDMEGVDSLIRKYGANEIVECAEAFHDVGACEIAEKLRASIGDDSVNDALLSELSNLITCRVSYSYDSILRYVNERI